MADEIRIVQFLHPGAEHRPDKNGDKPWNQAKHRRTFVTQPGRYVRSANSQTVADGDLQFWCEWESQARLIKSLIPTEVDGPKYLFKPQLKPLAKFDKHANTDPCVFGDCFRYCVCQQPSRPSLKRLTAGSLLLFGSYRKDAFLLDTVFVVARRQPYDSSTFRSLELPSAYSKVGLEPLFANGYCAKSDVYQLYDGATWDQPCHQMFSFFPCQRGVEGFARPSIDLPQYVNPRHRQSIKSTIVSIEEARQAWQVVASQVTAAGLLLGVSAEMPHPSDT